MLTHFLEVSDKHVVLLAEEMLYSLGRARISKLPTLKEKMELSNGQLVFTETARYFSIAPVYTEGIHTLNALNNIIIVDFVGRPKYPTGKKVISYIKKLIYYNK